MTENKKRILIIDFETVDPLLKIAGPGWAYNKINVIGCSVEYYIEGARHLGMKAWYQLIKEEPSYDTNLKYLKTICDNATTIVAHNAQYDLGILIYLGIDIFDKELIDTKSLAQLYDNTLLSYSLNDLSKKYLGHQKITDELAEFVRDKELYVDIKGKTVKTKDLRKCAKWAMSNLDKLYDVAKDLVVKYCTIDVELCGDLYEFLKVQNEWITADWVYRLSCLMKFLLKSRKKGIYVDRLNLIKIRDLLADKEKLALDLCKQAIRDKLNTYTDSTPFEEDTDSFIENFNPDKRTQLINVIKLFNLKYETRVKTGLPVLDKAWLTKQEHPFCKALKDYRRFQKVRRDFCDKILNIGIALGQTDEKVLILYPSFNIFGAETGRFSSNAPNLQQIPARDREIGPLLRSCFIPYPNEKWYQMDYGQQEFRLFSHFCYITKVDAVLKLEYDKDPYKDYHDLVAKMLGIERVYAKEINLGSLYGMGRKKQSLKLKERGLDQNSAESIYDKYHNEFPSVKLFSRYCADILKKRGYIKTLLGRRSRLDRPYRDPETGDLITFEYQAISKVIQGGAADQMIETIVKCYEKGLDDYIMFSIHDQVCISAPNIDYAKQVQDVMLNSVTLSVPMTAELGEGANWAESEQVKH